MPTVSKPEAKVKQQIIEYLERVPFERAILQTDFRELLAEDAKSKDPIFSEDSLRAFDEATALRQTRKANRIPSAFFSNKNVLIVPGFMGSQLWDTGTADNGLIWIDPKIYLTPSQLSALQLSDYQEGQPDSDAKPGVSIGEAGAVPILYAGLKYYLESGRCDVQTAGFDWRKDIDESATILADTIQSLSAKHPRRPLFVIAHSQGSLVARRALQLLGKDAARRMINRLILIGPASYGTFSAAFAIAGNHSMIESLRHYGLNWPEDLPQVLQSMSGLYQLLPWKEGTIAMDPALMAEGSFWESGCDRERLQKFFKWGESVDTSFFNDRTSIILGDKPTIDAVEFQGGKLVSTNHDAPGDGTVPDRCALIEGVTDLARAPDADHMTLPLKWTVMQTVWRIINANLSVQAVHFDVARKQKLGLNGDAKNGKARKTIPLNEKTKHYDLNNPPPAILELPQPEEGDLFRVAGVRDPRKKAVKSSKAQKTSAVASKNLQVSYGDTPPPPLTRRLRVFSFDPLLATDPDSMGMESIVLKLDWKEESADGAKLQPGPIGEYLEVVDYDPASRCFYAPVDLNHPNLLAQDGIALSETDPRFHQQMVYGVAMKTIAIFERALGRVVLWAPHLPRTEKGNVKRNKGRLEGEFVRRLRIYPHALREANAYYDPDRKSLLFGYFPAQSKVGSRVMPRGIVFTCLSYDVIAHETTHALLDGMHRYLLYPSNPDVLAFHEAFADIVALFQHFSHPEVLRGQVARVAGNLEKEGMLGQLAQQFGEAMGMHGSLRSYLGKEVEVDGKRVWQPRVPDPEEYATTMEPHDRGAILVAAMFTAFLSIYHNRTRDLMRIATNGSGISPPGDLHPDLVNRLAVEASKAASHLLIMAIRALDYVPPVDMNYGDYLRALITSDFDIVPHDGHLYRVAILDAFRQWGIYPHDVRNLSIESLIWNPPEKDSLKLDMNFFRNIAAVANGNLDIDRAEIYELQRQVRYKLHEWMRDRFMEKPSLARSWGLDVSPTAPWSIKREHRDSNGEKEARLPKFEVHSVRRCRRIGPNDQERVDILIEVVQSRAGYLDPADQKEADQKQSFKKAPDFTFRGGATIIVDPAAGRIRYVITKSISSDERLQQVRENEAGNTAAFGLRGNYFGSNNSNPFPLLHASED